MPPKVQQKTKEQKLAAALAGGKSRKKVRLRPVQIRAEIAPIQQPRLFEAAKRG